MGEGRHTKMPAYNWPLDAQPVFQLTEGLIFQ